MIDTHAHLNFAAFKNDIEKVIQRAKRKGVQKIIIPGAKIDSSRQAQKIASFYKNCFAASGIHPHHTLKYKDFLTNANESNPLIEEINTLCTKEKTIAVGEIGLDYFRLNKNKKEKSMIKNMQKKLLVLQLDIAKKNNLPVIFHCRNAFEDLFDILKDFKKNNFQGVFHCFSGDKNDLQKALKMNFYIGFDGNITYNKNLQLIVKITPLEKILLETDSPYLTPEPVRGTRNEPANLPLIADIIGKIKSEDTKTIRKITTENAQTLFRI